MGGRTAADDADTAVLDDQSQVLVLAAELAAKDGIDLGAFLDAHPDALDGLEVGPPSDTPIDLSDLGEDDVP